MLSALVIGLGLILVGIGAWILLRRNWFWQWLKGTLGLLCVASAVALLGLAGELYGYQRAPDGATVATVNFERLGPLRYRAALVSPAGREIRHELGGDLWQLDGQLLQWSGLWRSLGAEPGFRLSALGGRYSALEKARSSADTMHALASGEAEQWLSLWRGASEGGWLAGARARALSVAYVPMADGALFEVKRDGDSLVARAVNKPARRALGEWQ